MDDAAARPLDLWSATPRERVRAAADLAPEQRAAALRRVLFNGSWPFGMPTSINPLVVVVGASPGNRPAAVPSDIAPDKPYDPPTFGKPHPGFFYPDGSHYWDKTRILCIHLTRAFDRSLSEEEALAVSGHLNLGTALFGSARVEATDQDITRWVGQLLTTALHPRVIVTVGLGGLLSANPELRAALAQGGLDIPWERPEQSESLSGYRYSFKMWRLSHAPVTVITWPNHPSRHPFSGGAPFAVWRAAVEQARRLIA